MDFSYQHIENINIQDYQTKQINKMTGLAIAKSTTYPRVGHKESFMSLLIKF